MQTGQPRSASPAMRLVLAALCVGALHAQLSETQQGWLRAAEKHTKAGWTYVHIEGPAAARGFQYGYLVGREITESLRARRACWHYYTGMDWAWLLERSQAMFTPNVDAECLAEIDGMVEGVRAAGQPATSRSELIAHNGFFELLWYWWPEEKKTLGATAPVPVKQSCSSFIATGSLTADGGIVLGHNSMVDYPEADFNVILDVRPERGHRILMQTCPGWIHSGTDFFVTDAGLVGSETTIGEFEGFSTNGIPEFVRMRRATQDAGSIDEWCATMRRGNNGGYANAWLVGDIKSGEIARLELGLKQVGFERKRDGYFLGSNVAEDLKVLRLETNAHETDIRLSSIARRVRWKQLMRQHVGHIDVGLAQRFESDHFDAYLGRERPGSRSLCGHFELEAQPYGDWPGAPYAPAGTFDAKVLDTKLARQMSFLARWGSACGRPFDAKQFLSTHPQFDWMQDLLKNRPTQPWVKFRAGEKK